MAQTLRLCYNFKIIHPIPNNNQYEELFLLVKNKFNLGGNMTKEYNLFQVDPFTKEKFTGNPAGVITNADGLTDNEMQKIARELNNLETAFIFSSNSKNYDVYIRFFTPTNEVPICGYATIAAHYARAIENKLNSSRIYQKTGAGVLPVNIINKEGDYIIEMVQGKIKFGTIIEGINKEKLLTALNIMDSDLIENYDIQIVSTGHSKVMIGIKSVNTLNSLNPNYDALIKLSEIIKCNGFYVFTIGSEKNDILIHGRMFPQL